MTQDASSSSSPRSASADVLAEIVDEFLAAHREGLAPDVESYAAAYPELADRLRDLLPTLAVMEQVKCVGPDDHDHDKPLLTPRPMIGKVLGDYEIIREI